MKTKDGREVCQKIGGGAPSGYGAPVPQGPPGFAPVGPPSGYAAAPPSGYPAQGGGNGSYMQGMMRQQVGAPGSGYGAPASGYGAPAAYGVAAIGGAAAAGAVMDAQGNQWTTHQSNGRTYWANTNTGQTSWTNPAPPQQYAPQSGYGQAPRSAPQPPPPPPAAGGWTRYAAPDGRPYWSNGRETTWTDPTEWRELSSGGKAYYHNSRTNETKWDKPY